MTTLGYVLATANGDKALEISRILGDAVQLRPRPPEVAEVEETGATLAENALLKAHALVAATGLPAIADDTGLEVDALGGEPGVRSARFAGEKASYADNVAKLLASLEEHPAAEERRARFKTVAVAVWPDGRELIEEGAVEGVIAPQARGRAGFGYDPVFIPDGGGGLTFAELVDLEPEAKHRLSHRGRAFRALARVLPRS